jgi:CRP-like cAMP-binding protein
VSVSVEPRVETPSFFEGLSADAVAEILAGLETRRFPAGTIVVAEGDSPRQLYLVESGTAEVLTDGQPVGSVQPGTTIAEMSFFTHEPAAATVRAVDDVVVHPIGEREFERISIAHPQVYRNLTAILSARLARTNRLAARQANARGKLVVLFRRAAAHCLCPGMQHGHGTRGNRSRSWSWVRHRSSSPSQSVETPRPRAPP